MVTFSLCKEKGIIEKAGTLSLSMNKGFTVDASNSWRWSACPAFLFPPSSGQSTTRSRNPTLPSSSLLTSAVVLQFTTSLQVACRCPWYGNLFVRTCLPPMPSLAVALWHHPSLTFMPIPIEPLACKWPTRANGTTPKSKMISGLSATPETVRATSVFCKSVFAWPIHTLPYRTCKLLFYIR